MPEIWYPLPDVLSLAKRCASRGLPGRAALARGEMKSPSNMYNPIHPMQLLSKIQSPEDVKRLSLEQLQQLAGEIRTALLTKLSKTGGHVGPNLGVVEMTIAMHYVFDSPRDRFVFDISHQSYVHKMLTGRAAAFLHEAHYADVTGYTNPEESTHDHFNIGHTSTSVSLALGLATARDLRGEQHNVLAVIGDGSLSGGEAFEGLSNAAEYARNFIVVLNDNDMSIAENHGGLYQGLRALRESQGRASDNYFKSLGLDYRYLGDGHDLAALIALFQEVKGIEHPIVLHIRTQKGRGYALAEADREPWHYSGPFDIEAGQTDGPYPFKTYSEVSYEILSDIMKADPKAIAITAGVPSMIGFTAERRAAAGAQFVDVGIAEEHGVALASGLAKGGAHPVFATASTFIQRTYDQLSQDLAINGNSAVILSLYAGYETMTDVTHLGFFDIALMSSIPGLKILEPSCYEEYQSMLRWAMAQEQGPVVLRTTFVAPSRPGDYPEDYAELRYQMLRSGSRVAIVALGSFLGLGEATADLLRDRGIEATLISPRFASGVDAEILASLESQHSLVVTLENGVLDGGMGEKIARYYGPSPMRVKSYGLPKIFADRYRPKAFAQTHRLTPEQIAEDILGLL